MGNVVGTADRRGNLYPTKQRPDQKITCVDEEPAAAWSECDGASGRREMHRPCSGWERSLRRGSEIMDKGQVLLVNLAKGELGEDTAALLGGLLVTTIGLAAFSRADTSEATRRDFHLYIDEFQNFTTRSIANMTSELRKYHVAAVLAHQYLHQLEPEIRDAILGNVGTLVSFRLGPADAEFIAKEYQPKIEPVDLLNLPNHHIYLKLMIDGTPSPPFSAETLAPGEIALLL